MEQASHGDCKGEKTYGEGNENDRVWKRKYQEGEKEGRKKKKP
jgi:hypothetical protein